MASKTTSRARFGVLAGAAVTALLAFPGIASAAVTSSVANGALTVTSDAGDAITITAVNGQVKVNGVDPGTGAANASAVTSITVTGDAGANVIDLAGVTPTTYPGITGLNVTVNGNGGGDTIIGSEHADLLNGGDGDDRITPNDNPAAPNVVRDDARGDAGDDIITWNGGDDDDLNEGGPGLDTIQVNGAAAGETFTVKPGPNGRVIFDRAAPTPTPPGLFNIDAGTMEVLDLNMNAGDDTLTTDSGLGAFKIDAEGGDGNDTIDGGDAADLLQGGNNNDRIIPDDNPVNTLDVARGDADDDTIVWNGGDDNDVNEGGAGNDTTEVNGAPQGETFTVKPSTNAGRVQFDRTGPTPPGPFSIDIGTTERLLLNANDGDDKIRTDKGLAGLIAGEFNGGEGNDLVEGTDSPDRLNGDNGHDVILAKDKAEDLLDCGPGLDLARVDKRDFLRNCNIVIGGHLKVRVDAKKLAVANGVAALPLKCAGTKKCKGVVKLRSGGKTLAGGEFNIKKRSKTVHLKLNDKGRRLAALGKSVSVQIDAKDTKGNGWRVTQKLRLTR